jgi:hypothetical protein
MGFGNVRVALLLLVVGASVALCGEGRSSDELPLAEVSAASLRPAGWRRANEGWEKADAWWPAPSATELSTAARIHPAVIAALECGLALGALLLFRDHSPAKSKKNGIDVRKRQRRATNTR